MFFINNDPGRNQRNQSAKAKKTENVILKFYFSPQSSVTKKEKTKNKKHLTFTLFSEQPNKKKQPAAIVRGWKLIQMVLLEASLAYQLEGTTKYRLKSLLKLSEIIYFTK